MDDLYFCPTANEIESASQGGFDVCCDAAFAHLPVDQMIPGGCRYCGLGLREHGWRWMPSIGWHRFENPTVQMVKERMVQRRQCLGGFHVQGRAGSDRQAP